MFFAALWIYMMFFTGKVQAFIALSSGVVYFVYISYIIPKNVNKFGKT